MFSPDLPPMFFITIFQRLNLEIKRSIIPDVMEVEPKNCPDSHTDGWSPCHKTATINMTVPQLYCNWVKISM